MNKSAHIALKCAEICLQKNNWCFQWAVRDITSNHLLKNAVKIFEIEKEYFDCLQEQNKIVFDNVRNNKSGDVGEWTCLVFCFIAAILEEQNQK